MLPYLLIGFFSCSTIPCGKFFLFFKVRLIWAAKGGGEWEISFFEALTLGSTDNFFLIAQKKNECWDDSFSVWKRQICWNREFHILCVKKKKTKQRRDESYMFWGFIFLVYRNLSSWWSNLYGYGLEELWRQRLFNYTIPMLTVLFLLRAVLVWRMGNCIPLFEDTVHS